MTASTTTAAEEATDQEHATAGAERPPGGLLACGSCGIQVAVPDWINEATEPVDNSTGDIYVERVYFPAAGERVWEDRWLSVTRCDVCRMIRDTARGFLLAHPDQRARIGSLDVAVHRLESALLGLDAMAITDARTIDRLTDKGPDLRRLIETLAASGGMARWTSSQSARWYARLTDHEKARRRWRPPFSAARWAHVPAQVRQTLRDEVGGLLAHLREPTVRVLCPTDGPGAPAEACMMCGIGSVTVPRDAVQGAWVFLGADAVTLGGQSRPEPVEGCVCPTCDRAIDTAGAVGQSAMALAVGELLGVPRGMRLMERFDLVAWAVSPSGAAHRPNEKPWQHIDLREVREQIDTLLGRSR